LAAQTLSGSVNKNWRLVDVFTTLDFEPQNPKGLLDFDAEHV
jgi:hypothetical protein